MFFVGKTQESLLPRSFDSHGCAVLAQDDRGGSFLPRSRVWMTRMVLFSCG